MNKELFQLDDYQMSFKFGCLLANPQNELPVYFEAWQKISNNLLQLHKEKRLRDEVHRLPLLDHTKLEGYHQLCLAHMQLAFITTGYVWQDGDKGVAKSLPECLAIPLHHVSLKLGVKPIICHLDVVLSNWNLIDPKGPMELDNLECVCHIPGGEQGDHFCLVTVMVEVNFAKCLQHMVSALNLLSRMEKGKELEKQKEDLLLVHLNSVSDGILGMKEALGTMYDGLDANIFFNEIRPFLAGWGGPTSALPEGLIFEGVSPEPVQLPGGSAAQSTSLQVLDAFFGITHTAEEEKFLKLMRLYMPPLHAKLIEDVEKCSIQLVSYVKSLACPAVQDAYNKCITAMVDLRTFHIGIVTTYVLTPSRESNKKKYESLDEVGTGGSDLLPFLRKIRSDTKEKLVSSKSYLNDLPQKYYFLAFAACIASIAVAFKYLQARGKN